MKENQPTKNFELMPKMFEHLNEYFLEANLNYVQKTISVLVEETKDLDVIKWINYLKKTNRQMRKSPFVDPEISSMLLFILNKEGKKIWAINLIYLTLTDHEAGFSKYCSKEMVHKLELSYKSSSTKPIEADLISTESGIDD